MTNYNHKRGEPGDRRKVSAAKVVKKRKPKRRQKPISREWTVKVREPGTFRKGETIDQRQAGVEWARSPEAGNALQAGLERGQALPEPLQALVHQPIQRTLWQRFCGYWWGK